MEKAPHVNDIATRATRHFGSHIRHEDSVAVQFLFRRTDSLDFHNLDRMALGEGLERMKRWRSPPSLPWTGDANNSQMELSN